MTSPTVVGTATVVIRAAVTQVRKDIRDAVTSGWDDSQKEALAAGRRAGQRYGRGFKAGVTQSRIADHIQDQFKQTERDAGIAGAKAGRRYAAAFNAAANGVNPPTPQPLPRPGNGGGNNDGGSGNGGGGGGGSPGNRPNRPSRPTPRPRDTTSTHTIRTVLRDTGSKALRGVLTGVGIALKGLTMLALAAQAALAMQAAIAPLIALIGTLSQMGGVLLMLPALVNAVALPLAALAVGFSGIGGAFSAMKNSGENAAETAKAVANAQKGVVTAQRGVESAGRGVESAERGVTAAVRASMTARENLNDVIKSTIERVQDLNLELKGSALDEEDAVLGIERARERLSNMPKDSTALDYKEANLAIRQAQQRLDEVRESNEDLRDETKQANDEGVEGSRAVRDAKQGVLDAQQGELDAQQALTDAQRDLTDAVENLAEAFKKVDEAAKGSGIDEFEKAMAKLSPSAKEFVLAMKDLGPQWTEMRKFVQEKLFVGLASDVTNLANVYLPKLKDGLGGIATAFNGMSKDVIKAFAAPDAVDKFAVIMERVRDLIERMRPGIFALVGVWKNLATVGSEFFPQMGDGFTSGAQKLETWSQNFDRIREIIRNGIDVAKKFGEILGNLGSGIGQVFSIGNETGGGFLNGLISITEEFDNFVHSTEGVKALGDFFNAGKTAIDAIAPVIKEIAILVGSTLGPMLANFGAAISPAVVSLLQSLGTGIQNLQPGLDALVPVFDGLSAVMEKVLPILGTVISEIVTSLGPVLVTFMEAIGNVIEILAPAIRPVADALGAVVDAAIPLLEPIATLVALMAEKLAPIVQKIAEFIKPLIQGFADMLTYVLQNEDILWTLVGVFGALAGIVLATKIALMGYLVFVRTMMAVSKAWAIVTGVLNAVMSANPIALIVIAIAALVAAFVLAYRHSETFRNIVQTVWDTIKSVISYAWENVIKPVFASFIDGFRQVGEFMTWVWENLIKPAWELIKDGISLYWNYYVKPIFEAIQWGFQKLGEFFSWVWNSIIKPVWEALGNGISWVWENVVKPVWGFFTDGLRLLGDAFTWVWEKVIKPVWDALGNGIQWVWDNVIRRAFDFFKDGLSNLGKFVEDVVSGIKTAWDKLQDIIRAPVRFVVETVYNQGIKKAWNAIAPKIGLGELPDIALPPGFYTGGIANRKKGGVESGYSPGRDDRVIAVGGGEAIMRPEWTRAVGPGYVNKANAAARNGGVRGVQNMLNRNPDMPRFNKGGPVDLKAAPWAGGGGESNLKPAAILARRNIHKYWPEIDTIGGYRAQDAYPDHPSGLALDTMTGDPAGTQVNDWLHQQKDALALNYTIWKQFYKPAGGGGNMMEDRGSDTQNHMDHIHSLFNANGVAGISDGGVGSDGGGGNILQKLILKAYQAIISPIRGMVEKASEGFDQSEVGQLASSLFNSLNGKIESFISGKDNGGGNSNWEPSAGAEQWRQMMIDAYKNQGYESTPAKIDAWVRQIDTESGGDPNISQQITDVNGTGDAAGVGLGQMIPGTWDSYRDPALPNNRRDAWAMANAMVRYGEQKYGDNLLGNIGNGIGYDNGGWLQPGKTLTNNQSGVPEPVFTGAQWNVLKQGLNTKGADDYLKENLPAFQTGMQGIAVDALKETVIGGLFGDESFGIDGIINKLIDQALEDNSKNSGTQPAVSPGEAATGNPNAIADTVNFYGMDPQRTADEIARVQAQGMVPVTGRYREP